MQPPLEILKDQTAGRLRSLILVSKERPKTERTSTESGKGEAPERSSEGSELNAAMKKSEDQAKLMEEILDAENLKKAYKTVVTNGGAPGIDGVSTGDLKTHLAANWDRVRKELLSGTYKPNAVKRVDIPKPGGGTRKLGIPTVLDRFIQQAFNQVLQRKWDPTFSEHSYGFRPGRSAHQAVEQARKYIREGYSFVVDIDLEKFFDRVNHDILMDRIAKRETDKRVLKIIRAYLNAGMMEDGLLQPTAEGVPQGGPLSPLLSNLILDELDRELSKRKLHYVRYADDCNIYVASERAGQRVMESISNFLQKKLRLRVNKEKSAVGKPSRRKFLGFSFLKKTEPRIRLADQSKDRFKRRIRELTRPTRGRSLEQVILDLRRYLVGWHSYFRLCETPSVFAQLDEWIRRRVRCYLWRHWKRGRTRFKALVQLGLKPIAAARIASSAKGPWRISASPPLCQAISNHYLYTLGLPRLGSVK